MDFLDFGVLYINENRESQDADQKPYLAVALEGLKGTKFLGNMDQLRREHASKEQLSKRIDLEEGEDDGEEKKPKKEKRKTKKERDAKRSLE